jgi:hypothetical protein
MAVLVVVVAVILEQPAAACQYKLARCMAVTETLVGQA